MLMVSLTSIGPIDSFEGKIINPRLDYKKTKLNDINKFFEAKIATVYRDKNEKFIPKSSGIKVKYKCFWDNIK